MRLLATFTFALALAALTGCGGGAERNATQEVASVPPSSAPEAARGAGGDAAGDVAMKPVSLQQADAAAQPGAPANVERKIIRNASITLEADEPAKAAQRVASVAEARGGFVVTSETRQQGGSKGEKGYEVYTVELRVPAAQFDAALADIRGAGASVTAQKITGRDVTEEYIDLEARLRTQRALEAQLLEIMRGARSVSDAVAVQRELTNVRTEIERVEGRRRFLENQSSLSTIAVTIQPPAPLVSTTGFFRGVGSAFGEGVDIAAAVTLFLIRVALALIPVFLFVGLPAYFLLRFLVRRLRLRTAPPPPAQEFQPQPRPGGSHAEV